MRGTVTQKSVKLCKNVCYFPMKAKNYESFTNKKVNVARKESVFVGGWE